MRVILILFLIIFVIVSSLFLTTFLSKMAGSPADIELAADTSPEEEGISLISDIKPDTAPELEGIPELSLEDTGSQIPDSGQDTTTTTEEELVEIQDIDTDETEQSQEETEEEESNPEQDMVKIYLDGDMENGIYLGAASYGIQSSRATELYGSDLADTGFKFEWQNTDLDLEPGSTHYVYIYYYNTEDGWDWLRKEVDITGQKPGNSDIRIFIDEPSEQTAIDGLERIKGWAIDTSSSEGTGIDTVKIYLDGPRDFGQELGDATYGIARSGVVDFFSKQDYLYSGYSMTPSGLELEEGTKHTLFIYADSLSGSNNYNFEKINIFISGEREEKAVIEATIDLQALTSHNTLLIEGYAVSKTRVAELLKQHQEESTDEQSSQSTADYDAQKIVFKSNQYGNYDIFSINLDGTERQRLTTNSGDDLYPEASPDGKKIAYTADVNGVWQIMVMDWNGNNKKQITNNSYRSACPTWSHDMEYIYFEAYLDGDWELFRINSNGTGQKRLTYNSSGYDWHPSAHPFDSKLIFESGMPGHDDIYIMNSDGSAVSRIFSHHERRRTPDMSPDSTMLVYTRYFGNNSEVYYADISSQNEQRISHNGDWDGHPMFSPDGSLIVYEERSGGKEDIIIYNIETGDKTNLTNTGYNDSDGCFMYSN